MPLRAMLKEVDPAWYSGSKAAFDPELIEQACKSPLGQRLLVRALPPAVTTTLLAPKPGTKGAGLSTVSNWTRPRLLALVRDLGVLAYAPMIRAEIRREPVRWLRKVLGNSYLLALDRSIWDGRVDGATHERLSRQWEALVREPGFIGDESLIGDLLDRQGCSELRAWGDRQNRVLADWLRLIHGDEGQQPTHLPDRAVLLVYAHHEDRE